MFSAPLSGAPVLWSDGISEVLLMGDELGQLNLVRHILGNTNFGLLDRQVIGGKITWVGPGEIVGAGERGFVAASTNPDQLHFLEISTSSPYFHVLQSVDLPEDPGSVAFLGPDAEGFQQLVVSLPGVDQLLILRREADLWTIRQTIAAGDDPQTLLAMDLDQDLVQEIVVADRGYLSGTLSVLARGEGGVYDLREQLPLAGHVWQVRAGDLNQDGNQELVISYRDLPQLDILSLETGSPVASQSIATAEIPDFFEIISLPTGAPGLVTGVEDMGLMEFFREEAGNWEHQESYYVGCRPLGLVSCDFNGDGMAELACLGHSDSSLGILLGNSLPGFWGHPAGALSATPVTTHLADFDNNGYLDVVIGSGNPFKMSLYRRQEDGPLMGRAFHQEVDFFPGAMVSADFLGDNKFELVVQDLYASRLVLHIHSEENGLVQHSSLALVDEPTSLFAGDVDGDGFNDLLLSYPNRRQVEILFGQGDGTFPQNLLVDFPSEVETVAALALGPGSYLDLLVTDGQGGVFRVLNLDGRSFGPPEYLATSSGAKDLHLVDLDGDSDLDVVVYSNSSESVGLLENNFDDSLQVHAAGLFLSYPPKSIQAGDLTGDGIPDLLVTLDGSNSLLHFQANDVWQYTYGEEIAAGPSPQKPQMGDLNLDGKLDAIVLDDELKLVIALLNTELALVGVDSPPLEVVCSAGRVEIRFQPDRFETWELFAGRPGQWQTLAANGQALSGRLVSDQQNWVLLMDSQQLEPGPGTLVFRLVQGTGQQESALTAELPQGCWQDSRNLPTLRWSVEPYPNPFNPRIQARIRLEKAAKVDAAVFDLSGRRVATLIQGNLESGDHTLSWDGRKEGKPVAGGLYLLRIVSAQTRISRKIILLK